MKSRILGAVALSLAFAVSAFAADLPSRKAPPYLPPPPPPPLWTGFYVGLNAGGTWSNTNNINVAAYPGPCDPASGGGCTAPINYSMLSAIGASGAIPSSTNGGFIGGGQIGYNWQFNNSFVAGIEADIQGVAGSNGQSGFLPAVVPSPFFPGFPQLSLSSASQSLDYIGTVRGRLGWLITPTLLAYGTGGLAYGGVNVNYGVSQHCVGCNWTIVPNAAASFSDTRVGWTAGGGLEWLFLPNWSAKVEYLYYDLGTVTLNTTIVGTNPGNGPLFLSSFPEVRARFDGHIARAGVNYHFNWGAPAPVVAKY